MIKPESKKIKVSLDAACVLQYLYLFPNDFLTETEIARRAGERSVFKENPRWAHVALSQLLDLKLVETDGLGRYRVNDVRPEEGGASKRFIAPHLRAILERKGGAIDLSGFT